MNWAALRGRLPTTEPLILGGYAWTLTIATPCFEPATPLISRLIAAVALLELVAGWVLLTRAPRMADVLGTIAFVGLSVSALITLGSQTFGTGFPVVRMTIGSLVWCLFAISWARTRHVLQVHSAQVAHATTLLESTAPGPSTPLRSKLVLGLVGIICAMGIALYGSPRSDGHGAFITVLIVVAALKLTSAVGALLARLERAKAGATRESSQPHD